MIGRLLVYGVGERMTRRFAGLVVGSQFLVVLFGALVAYGHSHANGDGNGATYLRLGCLLAVLCLVAAGTLRKPWGVTLGWVIQIATLASALVVTSMIFVGLLFGALWVTALFQGHKMDELTRQHVGSAG